VNETTALCTSSALGPPDQASPRTQMLPAYATIPEWCRISGMGRSATYEAIGALCIRAKKVGARTLIDVPYALAYLDSLPEATIRPHGKKSTPSAAGLLGGLQPRAIETGGGSTYVCSSCRR
jgi:hypothetical protein